MWLAQLTRRGASMFGASAAVADESLTVSYEDLELRATRLASELHRRGLRSGERVAIVSRNRAEVIEAHCAIALAGAVAVPLGHQLVADELSRLAAVAEVRAVIGEGSLTEDLRASIPEGLSLDFDGGEYQRAVSGEGHSASGSRDIAPQASPDDVALILFTSATTSRPKGVVLTHGAVRASSTAWLASVLPRRSTVYLNCTPLSHSTLLIALAYLAAGAQLVLTRTFTPQRILRSIEEFSATQMYMVPSTIAAVIRARALQSVDCASLEDVFHGAEPMSQTLRVEAARALGANIRDCYGQAEAGGPITVADAGRVLAPAGPEASAGHPLLGIDVRICASDGSELPAGEAGEVWVRSDALMAGYLEDSRATAERLVAGWLRTQDVGVLDAGGELRLVGRRSDIVIRGGQNVYPVEVEEAIAAHPGVAEAAVVGVPHSAWGEVPVGFVVPVPGEAVDPNAIARFLRGRLAPFKQPAEIRLIECLPRSPTGKVLRRELRERVA